MNITDINKNKEHIVSEVVCLKCHKRWISVRPLETLLKDLECPNCGKGYVIETGEMVGERE
jgi:DNA-directed RNA polymerase subunit RPC12/RpoP